MPSHVPSESSPPPPEARAVTPEEMAAINENLQAFVTDPADPTVLSPLGKITNQAAVAAIQEAHDEASVADATEAAKRLFKNRNQESTDEQT